jgi:protein-disulfide isomerase
LQDYTQGGLSHVQPEELASAPDATNAMRGARLRQLGVVVAITVACMTAIVIATDAGGTRPPRPGSVQAIGTEQQVSALLAGIPQHANVLGLPAAPTTIEWFGDLQCPYCRKFSAESLPAIIRKRVRTGQVKLEYRSMETATRERKVFEDQQIAALAAGLQDKMWNFVETFYREQGEEDSGYVTETYLQGIASQVPGLNLALWTEDRNDPQLVKEIATDRKVAAAEKLAGTPSFLIGPKGGKMEKVTPSKISKPSGAQR